LAIADRELAAMQAHPLVRTLWWPRLAKALEWIDTEIATQAAEGRKVLVTEERGAIEVDGVRVHGRADRIDVRADGHLVVVDYKTGGPPTPRMVEQGFALQLGVLALIARDGGFAGVSGLPDGFEYWSLGKTRDGDAFGYVSEPVLEGAKKSGLPRGEFLSIIDGYLREAIARWIKGDEAFTARLNPDIGGYNDYDQLMRLDEWQTRADAWAVTP
jgi:ATP-dependent helicase/nuclease subunit B